VSRNITPRPIKAQGARDSHGHIFETGAGSLYVHMHREAGLAHRHYVLKPWQVRVLRVITSRPMVGLYVVALVSWGWIATQAARVPLLRQAVSTLTADAQRLDTLTATLAELQARYDHVQRLLSVANSGANSGANTGTASRAATKAPARVPPATAVPTKIPTDSAAQKDTTRAKRAPTDTTRPPTDTIRSPTGTR
jgi:hypothetical protein